MLSDSYFFDSEKNTFSSAFNVDELTASLKIPMSITLQVTRRCNLSCIYCSEDAQMAEPTLEQLKKMIDHVVGVKRVIVAGGEPTLRRDLPNILDYIKAKGFPTVSIASNAVLINTDFATQLSRSLDYADITIDGTPETHNKIRGQYERVVQGIQNLQEAGVPISLVSVLLSDNEKDMLEVCRIADRLGAKKLKILSPIRKGRGTNILSRRLGSHDLEQTFLKIKEAKSKENWHIRITLTDWNIVDEGHALLIHPDGDVVASPVPSSPTCTESIGNVLNEDIRECWKRYRFMNNHVKKYLEKTLWNC